MNGCILYTKFQIQMNFHSCGETQNMLFTLLNLSSEFVFLSNHFGDFLFKHC